MDKLCLFIRLLPADAIAAELKARGVETDFSVVYDLLDRASFQQKLAAVILDEIQRELP